MNKLETPCIQCGADRVYTHHNDKTAKWTVYCDTCVGGYASEEEAVDAYMRVVGQLRHYKNLRTELDGHMIYSPRLWRR